MRISTLIQTGFLTLSAFNLGVLGVAVPRDDHPQLWAGSHPTTSDLNTVHGTFYISLLPIAYSMVKINPLWVENNVVAADPHNAAAATFTVYDVNTQAHKQQISLTDAESSTPWWFDGWARAIGNSVNVDPSHTYLPPDAPGMELKDSMRLMTGYQSVEIETVNTGMNPDNLWDILQHASVSPVVIQLNLTKIAGPLGDVDQLSFNAVDSIYTQANVRRVKLWNIRNRLRDVSLSDLAKNVRQLVHTQDFKGYKGKRCLST